MFSRLCVAVDLHAPPKVAALGVSTLGALRPDLLICDIDAQTVDRLELIRQLRFVLPECIIVLYTGLKQHGWSLACHMAGINAMLFKGSDELRLADGLRSVLRSGCYTDPRFTAA